MKRFDIHVPEGIRYLGKWKDFEKLVPANGQIILNKSLPDCGATTWYLTCNKPVILASPRLPMLESKAKKHPDVLYFSASSDSPNRLTEYLNISQLTGRIPKIIVTYDSLEWLLSQIPDKCSYLIVIDEMQCLIGDASFKGDTVLMVVNLISDLPNVIYMSATVYEDSYLDNMDIFRNLQYYRLVWPESSSRPIQTRQIRMKSVRTEAKGIIEKYRALGYFETKILNSQQVYAREAVFFLNSVSDIIAIIRDNRLDMHDVNVICSNNAEASLYKKTKCKRGEPPQEGEPHKTFTFVTKASFEGADFNSTNAYTYIFCDPNIRNMALDLFIDIPQIMGRQRLESNPFKYEATIFYKTALNYDSENEFLILMKSKEEMTERLLNIYNNKKEEDKAALLEQYEAAHENDGFKNNYLTVIPGHSGQKELHVNNMVKVAETRAWDIQSHQYCNEIRILTKLEENNIHGVMTTPNDEITTFINEFSLDNNFERKMQLYCDYRDSHPCHSAMLEALTHLPVEFHKYYRILGSQKIRALSYKEKRIKDELSLVQSDASIKSTILNSFNVGHRYQKIAVKVTLQKIYNDLGLTKTAKATDLKNYFQCKEIIETCNGEKISGYEILGLK